jgi:23S rRNA maturation mini-RNase III
MIKTQDQISRERERGKKKQRGSCTDADQKVSFNCERCSSSLSVLAGYIYLKTYINKLESA